MPTLSRPNLYHDSWAWYPIPMACRANRSGWADRVSFRSPKYLPGDTKSTRPSQLTPDLLHENSCYLMLDPSIRAIASPCFIRDSAARLATSISLTDTSSLPSCSSWKASHFLPRLMPVYAAMGGPPSASECTTRPIRMDTVSGLPDDAACR